MAIFAHTKENCSESEWEPLYGPDGHAERTAAQASAWAGIFGRRLADAEAWLRVLGLYHDMGKASREFQSYLRGDRTSVDHKTAAAAYWVNKIPYVGRFLSYAFAGHHSELPNGCRLFEGDLTRYSMPDDVKAEAERCLGNAGELALPLLRDVRFTRAEDIAVAAMILVRMLHSCLVDADWLATEAYMEPARSKSRLTAVKEAPLALSERVEAYISAREIEAAGYVNEWRRRIHERCYAAANLAPGVMRLNVPTGGGKTLSSLSFALKHAATHGLERVIYVIPYTSIIEQTSAVFRDVLGPQNVVEHHSALPEENDSEFNRYASENWDAPVVVTTSVQFFESLFSCRNSRCRKIHNIARSVIVFDEVQSLPPTQLGPCLAVLRELQWGYGCSLLLCTATQPAFENRENFDIGWAPGEVQSLLGDDFERELFAPLRRVHVELLGELGQGALVNHFLQQGVKSALFIVNLTRQAQDLFSLLKSMGIEGLYHLSARMCPAHRLVVLAEVRERLKMGLPTVLVSTRVVEAGVDVSFPLVYRDRCGLDSLAQSAGRCNRHGEIAMGSAFMYEASEPEYALPGSFVELRNGVYAFADALLGKEEPDIFSPELTEEYFRRYYNRREGGNRWDASGVMEECLAGARALSWNFPQIDEAFQMIDGVQQSLFVPYGEEAEKLRTEILALQRAGLKLTREHFRRMQQLSVSVYEADWKLLQKECLHEQAGIYMLCEPGLYDDEQGLLRGVGVADEPKNYIF